MRRLSICTLVMDVSAPSASAIEMFTNFHNGQNIGFPPLEVPTSIYGGHGRGWNPRAVGTPLRTNPPVPAMMPTGQTPPFGPPAYWSNSHTGGKWENGNSAEFVGDRRRGRWQRSGSTSGTLPSSRRYD